MGDLEIDLDDLDLDLEFGITEEEEELLLGSTLNNPRKRSETDKIEPTKSSKRPRTAPEASDFESGESRPVDRGAAAGTTARDRDPRPVFDIPTVKFRRVLKHIPQDIPYIPITCENGSRVYLRILQDKKPGSDCNGDVENNNNNPLISTDGGSNRKLFSDWGRIKAEARVLKDKFHRTLGNIVDTENIVSTLGRSPLGVKSDNASVFNDSLWVEKYKPKSYMDLLSEENVNKALLHWLKIWDKSVFGNDYLAKVKFTKEKYGKLEAKEKEKENKFSHQQQISIEDEYDECGRPKVKVALLYGPPGLGKTTCAHVVGKHAGYSIREMNASDDRSVEIFRKVLDDATQSRAEIFQDGRPNCLIIDEIDGAPAATVNVLVDLITGNSTEAGKKKLKKVLKRPVICICNDLYAPSLKELKKHAQILHFHPVTVASLSERLNEISIREHLELDSGTIQSLCQKSECDIRSCLSTLQFLKKKRCSPKDAMFSQIGMKDKSKGIFAVWSDVFSVPDGKKYFDVEDPTKPEARFRNILRVVQSFGEYEKLQGGVFENYLRVKFKDCYLESIIEGLSWTTWFEDIRTSIDKSQNYVMLGYLPIYFVLSHFLYAQRGWTKIQFPNSTMHSKTTRNQTIIRSLLADISPTVGRYLDSSGMVTDLFPALVPIIQPGTIRPVPTQIWSGRERETLKNVVEVMIAYNLNYTQLKNPETGAYDFVLDPDILELVKFKLQDGSSSKRSFPYGVKQLVSREIETEKLRRSDGLGILNDVDHVKGKDETQNFKVPNPVKNQDPTSSKMKMGKWVQDVSAAVAKDFFGRVIAPTAESTQELIAQQRRSTGIYFRFKEGYSNAVRKFVKMKDLM